jgi:hypothetical protein
MPDFIAKKSQRQLIIIAKQTTQGKSLVSVAHFDESVQMCSCHAQITARGKCRELSANKAISIPTSMYMT